MTYRGHVRNGVVVFDDDESGLPDGTPVLVEPLQSKAPITQGSPEAVLGVAGTWQGDRAEMDRLLEDLREDKWSDVEV